MRTVEDKIKLGVFPGFKFSYCRGDLLFLSSVQGDNFFKKERKRHNLGESDLSWKSFLLTLGFLFLSGKWLYQHMVNVYLALPFARHCTKCAVYSLKILTTALLTTALLFSPFYLWWNNNCVKRSAILWKWHNVCEPLCIVSAWHVKFFCCYDDVSWNKPEIGTNLERLLSNCSVVAQSCPTFCDSVDCSRPGFPVLHHLPEFAQI